MDKRTQHRNFYLPTLLARLFMFVFIVTTINAVAQDTPKEKGKRKERPIPANIELIDSKFSFRPKFLFMGSALRIVSKSEPKQDILWRSYTPGVVGFNLRVKSFAFGIAWKIPSSPELDAKYVKTQFQDINITFQKRISRIHFFFNHYKGFYLDDIHLSFVGSPDTLVYPKRKKTEIYNAGINLVFQTNKNFSLNAAFAQSERQKSSHGAFLMTLLPRYTLLRSDSSLVPSVVAEQLYFTSGLRRASFTTIVTGVGMGYSFIGREGRFNVTPLILGGAGLQMGSYDVDGNRIRKIRIPLYSNARLAIGWNGDTVFTNIIGNAELNTFGLRDSKMRFINYSIELGLGIRF